MNKHLTLLVVGLLLVAACGSDPASVAEQFQNAVNSQDIESALELIADDAVLQVEGTSLYTGKAEIENWLATQAEIDYRIEGIPTASDSGVTFEGCSISSKKWSFFGVNPMTGTCEVALEGGLITSFAVQFDENSNAALSNSPAAERSDLVGTWFGTLGTPETSAIYVPNLLRFSDDGTIRWAVERDDLSIAPDLDHPIAVLDWTYEGYLLTVQNRGSAGEGYCHEQDVGVYLAKKTGDGEIQFKVISDSCPYRYNYLPRAGSSWEPYSP
jgi:hypothetical protein